MRPGRIDASRRHAVAAARASIACDVSPLPCPHIAHPDAWLRACARRLRSERAAAPRRFAPAQDGACQPAGTHSFAPSRAFATHRAHVGNAGISPRRRYREVTGFRYVGGELYVENVALSTVAQRHGTPCYVYSRAALAAGYRECDSALRDLPHLVCYALKANPSLTVIDHFARLGSGFDIVSGGELARLVAAGGDPHRTVFSGVGKSE